MRYEIDEFKSIIISLNLFVKHSNTITNYAWIFIFILVCRDILKLFLMQCHYLKG